CVQPMRLRAWQITSCCVPADPNRRRSLAILDNFGMTTPLLDRIGSPADVRPLSRSQLKALASELRAFVLESVSRTGGHLSSNLGTVALTVALHHVFNTPHDRIVWDVGHQTYPHKNLTGRRDRMAT